MKNTSREQIFLKWKLEGTLTHVILVVDDGVVICFVGGVTMHRLHMIGPVVGIDGSLKLSLQDRAMAG